MISVIITTYNQDIIIERAIKSVLAQTYKDYEILIINDGSTDNTKRILKKYSGHNNIRVFNNNHKGIMFSYLTGFKNCSGKYITFCDGDDYWSNKDRLKLYIDFMEKNIDVGVCLSNVYVKKGQLFDCKFTGLKNITYNNLLKGKAGIYAQSYFIRKSIFDKYINFKKFVKLKFYTWDYPIMLELIKRTKFHVLPYHMSVFCKQDESVTQTKSRKNRLKQILGNHKIKLYYIFKYGCKFDTILFIIYRFSRNIYSLIFKTWN